MAKDKLELIALSCVDARPILGARRYSPKLARRRNRLRAMLDDEDETNDLLNDSMETTGASSERRTITRRELARAVSAACSVVPKNRAGLLVDEVLKEIADALVAGQNVTLCNFGKFVLVEKKERRGRNPRTGEVALVEPRRVASFRPSRHLKAAIAKAGPCGSLDD
jgi:integration host factor subunit alpha